MSKLKYFGAFLFFLALLFTAVPLCAETFVVGSEDVFQYPNMQQYGFVDVRKNDEIRRSDAFSRLPHMHAAAMEILYRGDLAEAGPLIERVDNDLFNADYSKAARTIGSAFNQKYQGSRIVLGELSRTLQPLARDVEDFAIFMSDFLKGYPNNAVLIFTTEGVARHASYSPGRPFFWREAPADTQTVDMLDRVFSTEETAMIPFFDVEKFLLDLWGDDALNARGETAPVELWRVGAKEVVREKWEGGDWHKEILVLGDKIK